MIIPLPSQEVKTKEIMGFMSSGLDLVLHGYMSSGKTTCFKQACRLLKMKIILLDENFNEAELKIKLIGANIQRKNYYYHVSYSFLMKSKQVQKLLINPSRRIPMAIEIRTRYGLYKAIAKWPRIDIYYPKMYEIQKWLEKHHSISVAPNRIQKYKDIKQLLIGLRFGSKAYEAKKPLMNTLEAIIKSTDLKIRLSNLEYLQENYNMKYCLKIILFNLEKFYSSAEKFNVIRLLSICDKQRNLYPLLTLPFVYHKWIGRKLMYPKELEVET